MIVYIETEQEHEVGDVIDWKGCKFTVLKKLKSVPKKTYRYQLETYQERQE